MNVLAFAATNNSQSINKKLVTYAASLIANANVEIIDINDYELPIFSQDREIALGQPALAKKFFQKISEADAIIVSFAEHNGTYTAAYKNLFDWTSRIKAQVFQHKKVIYLATSPGPGGASSVLAAAVSSAHYFGAELKGGLSVPSFSENFDNVTQCLSNQRLDNELRALIALL